MGRLCNRVARAAKESPFCERTWQGVEPRRTDFESVVFFYKQTYYDFALKCSLLKDLVIAHTLVFSNGSTPAFFQIFLLVKKISSKLDTNLNCRSSMQER